MMNLTEKQRAFLEQNRSAAMITVARDGSPRVVRVGVAVVDGQLWSSGTHGRVRTKRLRRDPRCTLFVFDPGYSWLALDTRVQILDGPDVPDLSVRLFRRMQNRPTGPLTWFGRELDTEAFRQTLVDDRRLIYQFGIVRGYGLS